MFLWFLRPTVLFASTLYGPFFQFPPGKSHDLFADKMLQSVSNCRLENDWEVQTDVGGGGSVAGLQVKSIEIDT